MALDIIKDIVNAEDKADEMIKNAEADAASLKSEAERKGEEIIAEARQKSKTALNDVSKAVIEESRDKAEEIARQAELDCKKVKESAAARMEQAVNAVIGKVVGTNGNS